MAKSARWDPPISRLTQRERGPASARSGRSSWASIRVTSGVLNRRMDGALRGHPYVKSAIDVACWDILGKAANLPVVTLLGGALRRQL